MLLSILPLQAPSGALVGAHLPLRPEALDAWTADSDVFRFARDLVPDAPAYAEERLREHADLLGAWCDEVRERSQGQRLPPGAGVDAVLVPDLRADPACGLALKSLAAWSLVVQDTLEESRFVSLPHVLESESELECSRLLIGQHYAKQAHQVLRGFLEAMLLPLHFLSSPDAFAQWQVGGCRSPDMRGKRGVIPAAVDAGLVPPELGERASALYGRLNGAVHGHQQELVHRGIHEGRWMGQAFQYDRFVEWCELVAETVHVGFGLMHAQQQGKRALDQPLGFCETCWSPEPPAQEVLEAPDLRLVRCQCPRCGSEWSWVEQEGRRSRVVVVEGMEEGDEE